MKSLEFAPEKDGANEAWGLSHGGARALAGPVDASTGAATWRSTTNKCISFAGRYKQTGGRFAYNPALLPKTVYFAPTDSFAVSLLTTGSSKSRWRADKSSVAETTGNSKARRQPSSSSERVELSGKPCSGFRRHNRAAAGTMSINHAILSNGSTVYESLYGFPVRHPSVPTAEGDQITLIIRTARILYRL